MSARAARPAVRERPNRIDVLRFDFNISRHSGPARTPEALLQLCRAELLPVIDACLAELASDAPDLRIEALELDIGALPDDPNWPQERRRLAEKLRVAIALHLPTVADVVQTSAAPSGHDQRAGEAGRHLADQGPIVRSEGATVADDPIAADSLVSKIIAGLGAMMQAADTVDRNGSRPLSEPPAAHSAESGAALRPRAPAPPIIAVEAASQPSADRDRSLPLDFWRALWRDQPGLLRSALTKQSTAGLQTLVHQILGSSTRTALLGAAVSRTISGANSPKSAALRILEALLDGRQIDLHAARRLDRDAGPPGTHAPIAFSPVAGDGFGPETGTGAEAERSLHAAIVTLPDATPAFKAWVERILSRIDDPRARLSILKALVASGEPGVEQAATTALPDLTASQVAVAPQLADAALLGLLAGLWRYDRPLLQSVLASLPLADLRIVSQALERAEAMSRGHKQPDGEASATPIVPLLQPMQAAIAMLQTSDEAAHRALLIALDATSLDDLADILSAPDEDPRDGAPDGGAHRTLRDALEVLLSVSPSVDLPEALDTAGRKAPSADPANAPQSGGGFGQPLEASIPALDGRSGDSRHEPEKAPTRDQLPAGAAERIAGAVLDGVMQHVLGEKAMQDAGADTISGQRRPSDGAAALPSSVSVDPIGAATVPAAPWVPREDADFPYADGDAEQATHPVAEAAGSDTTVPKEPKAPVVTADTPLGANDLDGIGPGLGDAATAQPSGLAGQPTDPDGTFADAAAVDAWVARASADAFEAVFAQHSDTALIDLRAALDHLRSALPWASAKPDRTLWAVILGAAFGHGTAAGDLTAHLGSYLEREIPEPARRLVVARTVLARLRFGRVSSDDRARRGVIHALERLVPDAKGPTGDGPDADRAAFVRSAGLVLCAPFLGTLFQRAGVWQPGETLPEEAWPRALSLLSLLWEGPDRAPRPPDPLERCLLDLPPGAAVMLPARAEAEDMQITQSLLQALVEHWSALGDTSPEGLRETFLCRDGYLAPGDGGSPVLTVLPGTFDMLLDRLPWPLSPVRLAWMRQPLTVIWRL